MSTSTLFLGHFANLKLAGDRVVRDAILSLQSQDPSLSTSSAMRALFASAPSRPPPRPRRRRRTRRLHAMSDADLEAELAARRAARASERDRYARAMRSEKLTLLEGELARLRSEIARLDHGAPHRPGGTPPNARWESLPRASPRQSPRAGSAGVSAAAAAPPPRPPPGPPPPPLGGAGEADVVDPERQTREKAERQKRREQKRREREAAKKPMTLADIIRSAGPDPASRLKPSGSIAVPDVNAGKEPKEEEKDDTFGALRGALKKVGEEKKPDDGGDGGVKEEEAKVGMEGKGDAKKDSKGDVTTDVKEAKSDSDVEKAGGAVENGDDDPAKDSPGEPQSPKTAAQLSGEPEEKKPVAENAGEKEDVIDDESENVAKQGPLGQKRVTGSREEIKPTSKDVVSGHVATDTKEHAKDMAAADALAAISALVSSLPPAKANSTTANKAPTRMSLAEKRRIRRQSSTTINSSKEASTQDTQERDQRRAELADVLTAANALKLD